MIADAVARFRRDLNLPADPTRRGPVPLDRFFQEYGQVNLSHVALAGLTLGGVADHLAADGVPVGAFGEPISDAFGR